VDVQCLKQWSLTHGVPRQPLTVVDAQGLDLHGVGEDVVQLRIAQTVYDEHTHML
jgi:hypothetical protein